MPPNSKPNFIDRILEATLLRLFPRFITPNQLTFARILSVPFVIYLLLDRQYLAGGILFGLSALTDALDGAMARTRNSITDWGRVYDPVADKLLIASAAIILVGRYVGPVIAALMVLLDMSIGIAAAYQAKFKGKIINPHWTGKLKMILQSVGVLFVFANIIWPWVGFLFIAEAILYLALVFAAISFIIYKSA